MGSGDGEELTNLGYVNRIKSIYSADRMSAYSEPVLYAKARDTTVNMRGLSLELLMIRGLERRANR